MSLKGSRHIFLFPRIITNRLPREQVSKVLEELDEFSVESIGAKKDYEAVDMLQAVETLARLNFIGREDVLDSLILARQGGYPGHPLERQIEVVRGVILVCDGADDRGFDEAVAELLLAVEGLIHIYFSDESVF